MLHRIIALVLYTGSDTKTYQSTFFSAIKSNIIYDNHNLFTSFCFCHITVYTVVCFIFFLTSKADMGAERGDEHLISFLVLFSPMIPIAFPLIYMIG